ncbi:aminoglycoside phosphotransferase family protein [Actinomycetes bacterium KLBMP 9797]
MVDLTPDTVRTLVREQFPQWSDLPITPVPRQGWDNRTFRLGDDLCVRLPSGEAYVAGMEKEEGCLPALAKHLPLPVPEVVATGLPTAWFPFPWSVRRWLPGSTVDTTPDVDRVTLARDLGGVLTALREAPTRYGLAAGRHSHFRGCHPSVYGDQVQAALTRLEDTVDVAVCRSIWANALVSAWPLPPVWFHGDVAPGNLLVIDRRLSAIIDFGTCGVGDPACDLVIAWTYFVGDERRVFADAVGLPLDTWRRARGWALWKALATMAGLSSPDPEGLQARALVQILADPVV